MNEKLSYITNVQNVIEIIKEMNLHNASLSGMFVIYSAISIAIVTITGKNLEFLIPGSLQEISNFMYIS